MSKKKSYDIFDDEDDNLVKKLYKPFGEGKEDSLFNKLYKQPKLDLAESLYKPPKISISDVSYKPPKTDLIDLLYKPKKVDLTPKMDLAESLYKPLKVDLTGPLYKPPKLDLSESLYKPPKKDKHKVDFFKPADKFPSPEETKWHTQLSNHNKSVLSLNGVNPFNFKSQKESHDLLNRKFGKDKSLVGRGLDRAFRHDPLRDHSVDSMLSRGGSILRARWNHSRKEGRKG